jgi:hypothetical protein
MQAKLQEQLSLPDAEVILGHLPERVRIVLTERAAAIEYPIEAVLEMTIASSFPDAAAIAKRMFETYQKFLRSDAIPPVIEHHGLTRRSPLKGLKPFIAGGFNPFQRVLHC